MMPPLRSLMWKEWCERKWALLLASAWIMLGVVYGVSYELIHRVETPVGGLSGTFLLFGSVAAVFLAMQTSLGEVSLGTLGYSSALPVSLRRQGWVRLGGAIAVIIVPIALGATAMSVALLLGIVEQGHVQHAGIGFPDDVYLRVQTGLEASQLVWTIAAIQSTSGVELLLILSLIGTRLRVQSHLGLVGVCVILMWWILSFMARELLGRNSNWYLSGWTGVILPQSLVLVSSSSGGGSHYSHILLVRSVWLPLLANAFLLLGLATWFTCRYGRESSQLANERRWRLSWRLPAILSRLPMRWPGPTTALVWLNLRQAVLLCLAGLVLALLITLLSVVTEDVVDARMPERIAGQLSGATWFVALLWGSIVGSGVFASELEPRLEQFWRSRPISPSAWFWIKFLVGLAAVLGVLDLVTILVGWGSQYGQAPAQMSWAYVACMPLLHALLYSLAVLGTCWLRRPVLAAALVLISFVMVSSIAFGFIPGTSEYEPIDVYNGLFHDETRVPGGSLNLLDHAYPAVYGSIAAIIVVTALIAWRKAAAPSAARG